MNGVKYDKSIAVYGLQPFLCIVKTKAWMDVAMRSYIVLLGLFFLVVEGSYAAKPPKPQRCPTVVDLETNEFSRDVRKYKCFSKDVQALANGFIPISSPSIYQKLTNCSADLNSQKTVLSQCQTDLQTCRNNQPPPLVCPPPTISPSGLISIENMGSLAGAEIWSYDGKVFLGFYLQNKFDANSIANEFGSYGNTFSATSLFNEYGDYGSQFSSKSAYNNFTQTPPVIWQNNRLQAYVTTNKMLSPRVNPKLLKVWIKYDEY